MPRASMHASVGFSGPTLIEYLLPRGLAHLIDPELEILGKLNVTRLQFWQCQCKETLPLWPVLLVMAPETLLKLNAWIM